MIDTQFNVGGIGTCLPPTDRLPVLKEWYAKHIFGSQIDESVAWMLAEIESTRAKLADANAKVAKLSECTGHTYG